MKHLLLLGALLFGGCALFQFTTEPIRYSIGDTQEQFLARNATHELRPAEQGTLATWQWRGLFAAPVPATVFHFQNGRLARIEDRHDFTPRVSVVCGQSPGVGD